MSETKFSPTEIAQFYDVSFSGVVTSKQHNWRGYGNRVMRHTLNADGYPSVRLTVNGKRVRYAVHRLVAAFHLPARPDGRVEIRHLDGDKLNPSARNLAWGTAKDNAADRTRHGRTVLGTKHHRAKVNPDAVKVIREANNNRATSAYLAKRFNISTVQVANIRKKRSWAHVK